MAMFSQTVPQVFSDLQLWSLLSQREYLQSLYSKENIKPVSQNSQKLGRIAQPEAYIFSPLGRGGP